jgi:hypothetical protein
MPRALKVYFARLGFFESVVAAPSQAAALRAWGVHQDLFATGDAEPTDDAKAERAAQAHPGRPLKRAVGSHGDFALDAAPPDVAGRGRGGDGGGRARPPPDRSRLDAAEASLDRVEEEQARGEAEFFRRREALEEEEASARKRWAAACKEAQADVQRERRAFAKAGGH